jgi:hypothetical protein
MEARSETGKAFLQGIGRGGNRVPYRALLARIQQMFASDPDDHLKSIERGFRTGKLKPPQQPMSDQELARAIREFRAAPVSEWTMHKLSSRFDKK